MKKIFFPLFAVAISVCSCASDDELGCYEFTVKTVVVKETGDSHEETQLPAEDPIEFCGLTREDAAHEAADMSGEKTEEEIINGELVTTTTTTTATYRKTA